ncbi:unnamed protein product [Ambrosiozyma monospora]|uniref:Unnamed protein product n=1 Tax=Ambrosiozyma monospora TaxID=43982 RepID=A0ACB5SYI1_AMBMO|nr:unnamed protein product [Ambrosiozyma monospora]
MAPNILPLNSSDLKKQNSSRPAFTPRSFEFVIRFTNGDHDLVIPVTSNSLLHDVSTRFIRREIRNAKKELTTKRLKLIHNGRVLMDHTDFQKELKYLITPPEPTPSSGDENSSGSTNDANQPVRIYIHCLIGENLSRAELAKEEELERQPEKSTTEAPKGFDRLLSQGFSQQDILELRAQFQEIHGSLLQNQTEEALRELEDRWIDSTVNNEIDEFPSGLAATLGSAPTTAGNGQDGAAGGETGTPLAREANMHMHLFFGVSIGYLLGVFALFLLCLEDVGHLNRRTKMAVVAGVFVNFAFGILKAWS